MFFFVVFFYLFAFLFFSFFDIIKNVHLWKKPTHVSRDDIFGTDQGVELRKQS